MKVIGSWQEIHYCTAELEIDEEKFKLMNYYDLKAMIMRNGHKTKNSYTDTDDFKIEIKKED